jgi:hypothetical protein
MSKNHPTPRPKDATSPDNHRYWRKARTGENAKLGKARPSRPEPRREEEIQMTEDELNPLLTAVELLAMARGVTFEQWLREAVQEKANKEVLQFTVLGLPFVSEADREIAIAELAKAGVIVPATLSVAKH